MVSFQVAPHRVDAYCVRQLLVAQHRYEQVQAVRRRAVTLLAAAGGALWIALRGAVLAGSILGMAILAGWVCLAGIALAAGGFEVLWRRRRDQAAAVLPR